MHGQVPKGMVQVKVIEARHVPWLDWWSRPDCYVRLAVRDKHFRRTHTINNKLHPKCAPQPHRRLVPVHRPGLSNCMCIHVNRRLLISAAQAQACRLQRR